MFENFKKVLELFTDFGVDNPLNETLHVFDVLSNKSISKLDLTAVFKNREDFLTLVEQRSEGRPIEYILGKGSFFGKMFYCDPGALIPREETELLVQKTLDCINSFSALDSVNVIDMGTGCGSIAISIALNDERTNVLASDLNKSTIAVATKNVVKFKLEDRVKLFIGDLFAPLIEEGYEGNIDIIVCNPPYIPTTSLSKMDSKIIDFEPTEAFDGGAFGLEFYRRLINDSLIFLKPGGVLIFEIGIGQEKLLKRIFKKTNSYKEQQLFDDGDHIRVISVVKK